MKDNIKNALNTLEKHAQRSRMEIAKLEDILKTCRTDFERQYTQENIETEKRLFNNTLEAIELAKQLLQDEKIQ